MLTLLSSITVWYLVLAPSSNGQILIPSPFMAQEDCIEAGKGQLWNYNTGSGQFSPPVKDGYHFLCVPGPYYD